MTSPFKTCNFNFTYGLGSKKYNQRKTKNQFKIKKTPFVGVINYGNVFLMLKPSEIEKTLPKTDIIALIVSHMPYYYKKQI